ncbi:DNA replication licensing factor Mcm3 [Biomphalaria pfeifferi]|uniref:DNA replication licensing factor Mcm3 n=1 Tax=Biomphalaria pfeifferi TaxID=112525 RepID=A0AAD8AMV7_BIOPF|nr:DNA replication licensing factor Mcm3 [Biomphalaria pfeifferi]
MLKRHLDTAMIDEDKVEFVTNALYDYSADSRNPRVVDLDEFIRYMGTDMPVSDQDVRRILEDLAAKDLILFENGRIYLIN